MMHEEVARYRELSGDTNPNTPISRIGGYLDGYEKALEQTRWIPVSERMPEEHEWIGSKRFGTTISDEVYVTLENSKGERYTRHLSFQNGKLSPYDQQKVDAFFNGGTPIAWMPQPEPYKESEEQA